MPCGKNPVRGPRKPNPFVISTLIDEVIECREANGVAALNFVSNKGVMRTVASTCIEHSNRHSVSRATFSDLISDVRDLSKPVLSCME